MPKKKDKTRKTNNEPEPVSADDFDEVVNALLHIPPKNIKKPKPKKKKKKPNK